MSDGEPESLSDLIARFKTAPSSGSRESERRYNCIVCLDTGRVEVWQTDFVFLVATEGIESAVRLPWRSSLCACYCNAGSGFAKRIPKFDREKHCQVVPATGASGIHCDPEAIARLVEWIAECRKRRVSKPVEVEDPLFQGSGL
jgi:hypothetical protein